MEANIATIKLSLRLFLLIAVAIAPAAIILFYNLGDIRRAKEREINAEALRLSQLASLEMQRIINGSENVLIALSAAPVVQVMDPEKCSEYLNRVGNRLPQFSSIAVFDTAGNLRCNHGDNAFYAGTHYFTDALSTRKFIIGEFERASDTNMAILPLALPIEDDSKKALGVIVGSLDLSWLGTRLSERKIANNGALTIADRNGIILAREPLPEKFVGTKIPAPFLHLVNETAPGTIELVSQDGTRRVIGYNPPNTSGVGLYVSAGLSTAAAYEAINDAWRYGFLITLSGILAALVIAWLTSKHLIRLPVQQLVTTIDAWRAGNETSRTNMTEAEGEFGIVGKAIDDFMNELVTTRKMRLRSEHQRELLVGELDHRVKNLLATVQSVARQTFRQADQDTAVTLFTERLVAMGEAHRLLMKDEWQAANMGELISTAIKPFDSTANPQFFISGPEFTVQSKAALALSMALHEMCTNAVKYGALSQANGKISIEWDIQTASGNSEQFFVFRWREKDGPPVEKPSHKGFGSKMIERALSAQLNGEVKLHYLKAGITYTITAPYDNVVLVLNTN